MPTLSRGPAVAKRVRRGRIFGIDVFDYYDSRAVTAIADLGVKWVRIPVNRIFFQPSSGVYNWSDFDNFIIAMQPLGVQVLMQITETPTWIDWTSGWTAQYADMTTLFAQMVNRYKPHGVAATTIGTWGDYGVTTWEVFNEPNLPGFGWLAGGGDAAATVGNYAQCLSNAYAAIKAADPNARVVLGGLSSGGTVAPDTWTNSFYTFSPQSKFDMFAFHPYGFDGNFQAAVNGAYSLMAASGDRIKAIWFDEYGTNDEALAPTYLTNAFSLAQRGTVDAMFWMCLTDLDTSGTNNFGLMHTDYTHKAIYAQFKSLMASVVW